MSSYTTLDNEGFLHEVEEEIMEKLNFCGCGQPHYFLYYLYIYLSGLAEGEALVRHQTDYRYANDLLPYAYLADNAGWTDHGSSVNWCWLTDEGREVLRKLRRIDWEGFIDE